MGIIMVNCSSFFDELEKIAEDDNNKITKEKLKRLLKVVGVTSLGAGLGYATGSAVNKYIAKKFKSSPPSSSLMRWIPTIAGGLSATAAMINKYQRKDIDNYIKHGRK